MNHSNNSLSHSLSLFLHADSLWSPNTRRPTCQNFPLRGIQLWSSCLYRFYTGNSFPKTDCGDFWMSFSYSLFFFTGHQTAFEGVDAVRQTNYRPPTARGRLPYGSSCKRAAPGKVSLKGINAQECHRLLVSWLAPLCQTVSFFFFYFFTFVTLHKRRWKAASGDPAAGCCWISFFIFIFDNEGQKAVGSIWNVVGWSRSLKKPNVLFCLRRSGQEGWITGLSDFERASESCGVASPSSTSLWNLVDFFLSVLSSMEKSGSGFRALGSTGGQWTSIKPTRKAVMRRADWRAWTPRATWLTRLANLFFFFFTITSTRPHIPPWKRPISTPSWMQSFKILPCTKKTQKRRTTSFSLTVFTAASFEQELCKSCYSNLFPGGWWSLSSGLFFCQEVKR